MRTEKRGWQAEKRTGERMEVRLRASGGGSWQDGGLL